MSGVDVLAALKRRIDEGDAGLIDVADAVAGLTDKAEAAVALLESVAPHHPQTADLRNALARCRGGAA